MKKKLVRAIFPGPFDPITSGHTDIIERRIKLLDEFIAAVGGSKKTTLLIGVNLCLLYYF